jgi:hypothetical protein
LRKLEDEFDRVIRQDLLPSDRDALFEKVRSEENNGLIVMLTKSDDYWKVVRALVGDGQAWTQNDTKALAAVSRVFIHDEHAQVTAATYAPNWRRGRALRTSHFSQQIIDELQGLGTGPAPFQVGEIGLPPLAAALAQRASGDPRRLLAQALEIRQAAAPLRRHLARLVRATEDGDDEMIRLAGEELKYLTIELQTAVTVHEVEGVNALDMFALDAFVAVMVGTLSHPMYGLMAAGVMGALTAKKKAIERLLRRRRQRIAVLSELAGELGPARIQPQALAQLQHGISSKRDAAPAS